MKVSKYQDARLEQQLIGYQGLVLQESDKQLIQTQDDQKLAILQAEHDKRFGSGKEQFLTDKAAFLSDKALASQVIIQQKAIDADPRADTTYLDKLKLESQKRDVKPTPTPDPKETPTPTPDPKAIPTPDPKDGQVSDPQDPIDLEDFK